MIDLIMILLVHVIDASAGVATPPLITIPGLAILAQGVTIPGLANFVTFLQTISFLLGISLLLFGAWQTHQGRVSDGALSIIAGFISCVTVPVIRLIAGWTGGAL
jgi:hypothetical protein